MPRRALSVAHAMPGRLRLRLPVTAQTAGLVDVVRAAAGVTQSVWNDRTRSLLVHYRPEDTTREAIVEVVAEHAGVLAPDHDSDGHRETPVADGIATSVTQLNTGIARATGGRLDLGILVPLALGTWAFRQMFRAQVEPLSWSSALWYAHGLFRDYATRHRP